MLAIVGLYFLVIVFAAMVSVERDTRIAQKNGWVVTFCPEKNPVAGKSVLAHETTYRAITVKLNPGKYTIYTPLGFAVIGGDVITIPEGKYEFTITLTNGTKALFVKVADWA